MTEERNSQRMDRVLHPEREGEPFYRTAIRAVMELPDNIYYGARDIFGAGRQENARKVNGARRGQN